MPGYSDTRELYDKVKSAEYYTGGFNDFLRDYGSDEGMTELHGKLNKSEVYTGDLGKFKGDYFSHTLKKKDVSQISSQESPSQEKASQFRTVSSPEDYRVGVNASIQRDLAVEGFDTGVYTDKELFEKEKTSRFNQEVTPEGRMSKFNVDLYGLKQKYDPLLSGAENKDSYSKTMKDYHAEAGAKAAEYNFDYQEGDVSLKKEDADIWDKEYGNVWKRIQKDKAEREKDPYVKNVLDKFQAGGERDVMLLPYRGLKAVEKLGNVALTPLGFQEADYWKNYVDINDKRIAKISEQANRYEDDVLSLMQQGKYADALGKTTLDLSESIPLMTTLVLGNAAGSSNASLALMGSSKALSEYDRMDRETDLPEWVKASSAITKGLNEVIFESIGTNKILNSVKAQVRNRGKDVISKELASAYQSKLQRSFASLGMMSNNAIREGASEAATELADNLVDISIGEKGVEQMFEGVPDAAAAGIMMGGGMSVPAMIPQSEKTGYIKDKLNAIPEEYPVQTKMDIIEQEVKRDELVGNKDKAKSEGIKKAYDKNISAVEKNVEEIIGKEEGLIEEPPKKATKPVQKPAKEKKSTEVPEKKEKAVEAPTEAQKQKVEHTKKQLNDLQQNQYDDMIKDYGIDEATRRIELFMPEVEKYKYEPSELTKLKKEGKIEAEKPKESILDKPKKQEQPTKSEYDKKIKTREERITKAEQELSDLGEKPKEFLNDKTKRTWETRESKDKESLEANKKSLEQIKEQGYAKETTQPTEAPSPKKVRVDDKRGGEEVHIRDVEQTKRSVKEESTIDTAKSIEELDALVETGKVKATDNKYRTLKYEYGKKGWIQREDVPKSERKASRLDINTEIAKESEKAKGAAEGAGFIPILAPVKNIVRSVMGKKKGAPRTTKGLRQEYFRTAKGAPKEVHKATIKTTGAINARMYDVELDTKHAIKEAEKVYGVKKLSDAQYEEIQTALESMGQTPESRHEALKNIPEELHVPLTVLRNNIDAVTKELKKLEIISPGMEVKFDENEGYYLTRSYKKHTDPEWTWAKVPDEIKEDAANVIAEYYPDASTDEVLGITRSLLETSDVSAMISSSGVLGQASKDILKKRSDFLTDNPEIRALLGESRDPFYNYALSMSKMIEMAERAKLMDYIRDTGMKEGWASEKASNEKNHISRVGSGIVRGTGFYTTKNEDGTTTVHKKPSGGKMAPLSELYVTPEMAEILSNFDKSQKINSPVARLWLLAMNRVKLAKTAQSVKGQVRNLKSNTFNAVANGNIFNLKQTAVEVNKRWKKENRREFIRELKSRVIIDDSVQAREIIDNIESISNHLSFIDPAGKGKGTLKKVDEATLKLYALGDDVWKAWRYVSEYVRYRKVYEKQGMPDAELAAKDKAADIMHKTSTYYSMLPKIMQSLRKFPVTGTFISFPYLTARNFLGTAQTAITEMKDSNTAHIGVGRVAGLIASVGTLSAMAVMKNAKAGKDEEDMEELRRFLPDFWANDIIVIQKDMGNGVYRYKNNSYLDYYNSVTTPVLMGYRKLAANGTITDSDIADMAMEILEPYMSWDILFDKVSNLKANKDQNGRAIYNEEEDMDKKMDSMMSYLWDAFEPATITDVRRIHRTAREGGDWKSPMFGTLTGSQMREIDIAKSIKYFKIPQTKDRLSDSQYIYKKTKWEFDKIEKPTARDEKNKSDAYDRATAAVAKVIEEAREDYLTGINQGADKRELEKIIKEAGLDVQVRNAILKGYSWDIDEETGSIIK